MSPAVKSLVSRSMPGYAGAAARAAAIARAGGLDEALASGALQRDQDVPLAEALVLGLLRQGVHKYVGVFGHGSTAVGEALRIYEAAGLVRAFNVRSEIEASHVAAALRWQYGETAAVFTSIGPGALQALAASIAPASNGLGLYYLFGDETSQDEGYNMQQIPRQEQVCFLKAASAMGAAYSLLDPWALPSALKRGATTVFAADRAAPFYLFLPMNAQAAVLPSFNLEELPRRPSFQRLAPADDAPFVEAARMIAAAERVTLKAGNGARGVDPRLLDELLRRADAAYVHGPSAVGVLPGSHPRNMGVGGSKGSISGNAAMARAELAIVVGARAVCQWDSSGTAWASARSVIAINARPEDAAHYNRSLPLVGDAAVLVERLVQALRDAGVDKGSSPTRWYGECRERRAEWDALIAGRLAREKLYDSKLGREAMTQPAAIAVVAAFAREKGAVKYFDAGDVQANGFQLVEDETLGATFTETGASYMGFAASGILASALADSPSYPIAFTGDGSFMMGNQVIIDAVEYGLRGMVVVFDNRRMAAISSLQRAQYCVDYRTDDRAVVDYAAMASSVEGVLGVHGGYSVLELRAALEAAYAHTGLSVVHVPVYAGSDDEGGLGAYGDWNVGAWCERVQREKHRLGW